MYSKIKLPSFERSEIASVLPDRQQILGALTLTHVSLWVLRQ